MKLKMSHLQRWIELYIWSLTEQSLLSLNITYMSSYLSEGLIALPLC